jgi:hypothetical protein
MIIGLQTEKPIQSIEQPKAIQSIEQPKAQIEIETIPGKLTIDQSRAWAELGIKSWLHWEREYAEDGVQKALEGVARRIRQGDDLMKIETKSNPIPAHAIENGYKPEKQFNIGWIPSHGSVKLHYQPTEVKFDVTPQKPIIEIQAQKPVHEYTPGKATAFVEQWNSLEIDFVNLFNETI